MIKLLYGERVRYARKKLGLSRMKFAVMLDMTERSIANVENSKDESVKLSFERMKLIIEKAELPAGYFFYTNKEFMDIVLSDHAPDVYTKGGHMLDEEFKEVLELSKQKLD